MDLIQNIDIIGFLGFAVAAYTFIRTQIVRAKIETIVGPSISVYYTGDGGTGFYVPIAYFNETDRGGKIVSTSIKLHLPEGSKKFTMRWAHFVTYDAKVKGYNHIDESRAFSVPGQSVVDKFIWFIWRPSNPQTLDFVRGSYILEVLVATSRKSIRVSKYEFELSEDDVAFLNSERAKNKSGTRTITFKNQSRENIFG